MGSKIIIAGQGTGVGKTIVSAILLEALKANYWKPIESGVLESSDVETIKNFGLRGQIFESSYALKASLSPHAAALLEAVIIDPYKIEEPKSAQPLIIEMAGGVLTPLNEQHLNIDLFSKWKASWILVSKHYLGSINHTLLTLEALKKRNIELKGLIFNGNHNPKSEEILLHHSKLPCLGRLNDEDFINKKVIKKYAKIWKEKIRKALV